MRNIFKYPFTIEDKPVVELPTDAIILHVGVRHGVAVLWALVDIDSPLVPRELKVYGTGHHVRPEDGQANHLGTIFIGPFVWHIFETVKS